MLAALLLAAATCSEPQVSIHLAVSDQHTEWLGPLHGPRGRFRSCSDCQEIDYDFAGRSGRLQIDPEPILRIDRKRIASSEIRARSRVYQPEHIYYQLVLYPDRALSQDLTLLVERNRYEVIAVLSCSEVMYISLATPPWTHYVFAGVFDSEVDARRFADRLGLDPTMHPFDREKDERDRVDLLRVILGEYAGERDARKRIAREEPELHGFLEAHPRYWSILSELEAEQRP